MDTAANGNGKVRLKPEKLTMEDYLLVVDHNKLADLTVDQLNQIIDFHGFKKIHKMRKRIVYEAVCSMVLMKPSRSTLQDPEVSSCAVMSLDDVTKGLGDLGWQECCVTSLQMFNSVDIEPHHLDPAANSSGSVLAGASVSSSIEKQPRRRRRRYKLKKLTGVVGSSPDNKGASNANADSDDPSHGLGTGGSKSAPLSHVKMKLVPKRKRSPRVGGNGRNTNLEASASVSIGIV